MFKSLLLRLGAPLVLAFAAGTYFAVPFVDRLLTEWFRSDVELRAKLVMNSIHDGLMPLLARPSEIRLRSFLTRMSADERLLAIAICSREGRLLYRNESAPAGLSCPAGAPEAADFAVIESAGGRLHLARFPLERNAAGGAYALLVHDLSFIDRRESRARDYIVAFTAIAALLLALLCVSIAWLVLRGWGRTLVDDIRRRDFLADAGASGPASAVMSQVRQVLREIERQQRLELDFRENWTAEALRHVVREHLEGAQMIVVSNREPYIHNRTKDAIRVEYPASGMVTALEPVIRACSGVWVAHGSGSADREVVDSADRVQVPPQDPSYALRRVWMSAEEEEGYYYGLANEGLWPLCHLAFVRPVFRESDWTQYLAVNRRFADAVAQEARERQPLVLVQDYHFAPLPALIRERLPQATIALFWHIPWPNPAAIGICPWKTELLRGMLRADILGFHTRFHCQNFLASVDRYVESHIDHEHSTVTIDGHVCHVEPYPISIEWPPRWVEGLPDAAECRRRVFGRLGLPRNTLLGVGIERWDFTKGIVERLLAFERLLEREPEWRGRLVLLQIAAPSRSRLPAYQELQRGTIEAVERVNARFGAGAYRPVLLVGEHRDPAQVYELYRASDFCVVNSLDDGMNLVAKEFVAAREDEDGVLVLSTFAGASRELVEAVIVNPFDVEATAQGMAQALRMNREERQQRMRLMRHTVKQNNVFRWAGRMLMDAARIRQRERLRELERRQGAGRWNEALRAREE